LPMYYRGSDIILMVFDLSSITTINDMEEFFNGVLVTVKKDYKIIIIGNKYDLVTDDVVVNAKKLVNDFMNKYETMKVEDIICISAKTGYNFEDLMQAIMRSGEAMKLLKGGEERDDIISFDSPVPPNKCSYC
jgi:GTPase SAR1 family protein